MDIETFVQHVLNCKSPPLPDDLPLETARTLADRLKAEADRLYRIDANLCLHIGDVMILMGRQVDDLSIVAFGQLVRGDAFRFMHQNDEAWQILGLAGDLYQQAGDEIGWARTRTSRLALCVDMDSVESSLRDAEVARHIFRKYNELEKLARLEINTALVLNHLAQYSAAIEKCEQVLAIEAAFAEPDSALRLHIYINIASAHQNLGQLQEALNYYERARELHVERDETRSVALVDLFIINVAQAQGHNRKALRLLHETIDVLVQHQATQDSHEMMHLIDYYLFLNRFNDARDLAHKVMLQHPPNHETFGLAVVLFQLSVAEASLGDFSEAFVNLGRAEQVFKRLNAAGWLGSVYLHQGQIALRQRDLITARQSAGAAAEQFHEIGQQVSYLAALLLVTRVEIAAGQFETALQIARDVQQMARQLHIPHLNYEAHLLLGRIAESIGRPMRALRHYQVATAIMERIQRSLVLTARAEFLADKQDSVGSLVRLNLELGRTEAAFAALERAKAQVWLGYLSQLDHLRWLRDDPQTQPLIYELTRLREEHHWFYRIASDPVFRENQHVVLPPAEAAVEASTRERRLRALTEQLYLHSGAENLAATAVVTLSDIQRCLTDGTALIAYYNDGRHLWAFLLNSGRLDACQLPEPVSVVEKLLDKWQSNINRALRTAPGSTEERILHDYALPLAGRLYDALLRPLAGRLRSCEHLVIVPYGALHYLPFQLLHDGEGYLIERREVVILPTASLLTRPAPHQGQGALALAYNWDGRLQYTGDEAGRVVARFGGGLYCEGDATQVVLETPPCQVLHISAHGQYRIDQPDFSYIQLADGPLYTDDLFQHDLRYELVTLSACETGRSRAAAGDELIGLGRGFLFAGAGALIASLWRVEETLTLELMDELYHRLDSGASKAAALRGAQLALMRAYPGLHPAFWGAFELIGNADPLTIRN
jgi:CHAT domain-containing protein/tetratricopeptide (TPR) repeat protein